MKNVKYCAILVQRPEDIWEATRSSLGLAAHNYYSTLFLLGAKVEMSEALRENLDWLEEMECEYVSDRDENAAHGFKIMPLEKIGEKLRGMDLIVPFGARNG